VTVRRRHSRKRAKGQPILDRGAQRHVEGATCRPTKKENIEKVQTERENKKNDLEGRGRETRLKSYENILGACPTGAHLTENDNVLWGEKEEIGGHGGGSVPNSD